MAHKKGRRLINKRPRFPRTKARHQALRRPARHRRQRILIRQRGTRYKAGRNVGRAKDDSLFAMITGVVRFEDKGQTGHFISVLPLEEANVGGLAKPAAEPAAAN